MVDDHNKLHNPDGKPHMAADRKRTACCLVGYCAVLDRMTYDESSNIGGMAPIKCGVCLDKTIRVKKDTLRQLA